MNVLHACREWQRAVLFTAPHIHRYTHACIHIRTYVLRVLDTTSPPPPRQNPSARSLCSSKNLAQTDFRVTFASLCLSFLLGKAQTMRRTSRTFLFGAFFLDGSIHSSCTCLVGIIFDNLFSSVVIIAGIPNFMESTFSAHFRISTFSSSPFSTNFLIKSIKTPVSVRHCSRSEANSDHAAWMCLVCLSVGRGTSFNELHWC